MRFIRGYTDLLASSFCHKTVRKSQSLDLIEEKDQKEKIL